MIGGKDATYDIVTACGLESFPSILPLICTSSTQLCLGLCKAKLAHSFHHEIMRIEWGR